MEELRQLLMDYYGTALCSGNPMAAIKLAEVETASPQQLLQLALDCPVVQRTQLEHYAAMLAQ